MRKASLEVGDGEAAPTMKAPEIQPKRAIATVVDGVWRAASGQQSQ
jgi:hypothetical protein